jgi:hypothetical protein
MAGRPEALAPLEAAVERVTDVGQRSRLLLEFGRALHHSGRLTEACEAFQRGLTGLPDQDGELRVELEGSYLNAALFHAPVVAAAHRRSAELLTRANEHGPRRPPRRGGTRTGRALRRPPRDRRRPPGDRADPPRPRRAEVVAGGRRGAGHIRGGGRACTRARRPWRRDPPQRKPGGGPPAAQGRAGPCHGDRRRHHCRAGPNRAVDPQARGHGRARGQPL